MQWWWQEHRLLLLLSVLLAVSDVRGVSSRLFRQRWEAHCQAPNTTHMLLPVRVHGLPLNALGISNSTEVGVCGDYCVSRHRACDWLVSVVGTWVDACPPMTSCCFCYERFERGNNTALAPNNSTSTSPDSPGSAAAPSDMCLDSEDPSMVSELPYSFRSIAGGTFAGTVGLHRIFTPEQLLNLTTSHVRGLDTSNNNTLQPPYPSALLAPRLGEYLRHRNPNEFSCVLFYAEWCPFSTSFAVYYFLAQSRFPSVRFLWMDGDLSSSQNAKYSVVGFPTIMLFNGSEGVGRFQGPQSYQDLEIFVTKKTRIQPTRLGGTLPTNERPSLAIFPFVHSSIREGLQRALLDGDMEAALSLMASESKLPLLWSLLATQSALRPAWDPVLTASYALIISVFVLGGIMLLLPQGRAKAAIALLLGMEDQV